MSKVKKDGKPGALEVKRDNLQQEIIDHVNNAVEAWGKEDKEGVAQAVSTLKDLGVAWEQLKAFPDMDTVLVFPGVGAHLDTESDSGKLIQSLSSSVESLDAAGFSGAVQALTQAFGVENTGDAGNGGTQTQENTGEGTNTAQDPTTNTNQNNETSGETNTQTQENTGEGTNTAQDPTTNTNQNNETSGETNTQTQENTGDAGNTSGETGGDAGSTAVSKSHSVKTWGPDLAAEHKAHAERQKAQAEIAKEQKRKEKAASYRPEPFSWDNVVGGEHKGN